MAFGEPRVSRLGLLLLAVGVVGICIWAIRGRPRSLLQGQARVVVVGLVQARAESADDLRRGWDAELTLGGVDATPWILHEGRSPGTGYEVRWLPERRILQCWRGDVLLGARAVPADPAEVGLHRRGHRLRIDADDRTVLELLDPESPITVPEAWGCNVPGGELDDAMLLVQAAVDPVARPWPKTIEKLLGWVGVLGLGGASGDTDPHRLAPATIPLAARDLALAAALDRTMEPGIATLHRLPPPWRDQDEILRHQAEGLAASWLRGGGAGPLLGGAVIPPEALLPGAGLHTDPLQVQPSASDLAQSQAWLALAAVRRALALDPVQAGGELAAAEQVATALDPLSLLAAQSTRDGSGRSAAGLLLSLLEPLAQRAAALPAAEQPVLPDPSLTLPEEQLTGEPVNDAQILRNARWRAQWIADLAEDPLAQELARDEAGLARAAQPADPADPSAERQDGRALPVSHPRLAAAVRQHWLALLDRTIVTVEDATAGALGTDQQQALALLRHAVAVQRRVGGAGDPDPRDILRVDAPDWLAVRWRAAGGDCPQPGVDGAGHPLAPPTVAPPVPIGVANDPFLRSAGALLAGTGAQRLPAVAMSARVMQALARRETYAPGHPRWVEAASEALGALDTPGADERDRAVAAGSLACRLQSSTATVAGEALVRARRLLEPLRKRDPLTWAIDRLLESRFGTVYRRSDEGVPATADRLFPDYAKVLDGSPEAVRRIWRLNLPPVQFLAAALCVQEASGQPVDWTLLHLLPSYDLPLALLIPPGAVARTSSGTTAPPVDSGSLGAPP